MKETWKSAVQRDALPERRSVMVGDIVTRHPIIFSDHSYKNYKPLSGKVIYVHPKGRFHVVEFTGKIGTIREAFLGVMT